MSNGNKVDIDIKSNTGTDQGVQIQCRDRDNTSRRGSDSSSTKYGHGDQVLNSPIEEIPKSMDGHPNHCIPFRIGRDGCNRGRIDMGQCGRLLVGCWLVFIRGGGGGGGGGRYGFRQW